MSDLKKNIRDLIAVTEDFDFLSDFQKKLSELNNKLEKSEIIVPVVGEFSAGKSSLVNALIGNDLLKINVTPTTAIINEIRFSCNEDSIDLIEEDDSINIIKDLNELKNMDLSNKKMVKLNYKNTAFPKGFIFVDTPGLTSDINAHERTILDYGPTADAFLVAIDVNQGLTNSTSKFLETVNPYGKKVYIVLTKADSKSENEVNELISYLTSGKLPVTPSGVIVTSSKEKNTIKLVELINSLCSIKEEILKKNISNDIKLLVDEIKNIFNLQIDSSELSCEDIDIKIKEFSSQLNNIRKEIDNKIRESGDLIDQTQSETESMFKRTMQSKMKYLIDIAFDDGERLEEEFDNCLRKSVDIAIETVFKPELEETTRSLIDDLQTIVTNLDVGDIKIVNTFKGMSQVVVVILMDIILPGGILAAAASRLAILFGQKWDKFDKIWSAIEEPIKRIVEMITKTLTKGIVEKQINNSIDHAYSFFHDELGKLSSSMKDKIESGIHEQFDTTEKNINLSLEALKNEKQKKYDDFIKYIDLLKTSKNKVISISDLLV